MSGANQYVSLPRAVANARTFTAWVNWNGGAAGQRVFDFGNDTSHYLYLTSMDARGVLHFGISSSGSGGEQALAAPTPLLAGVWTHVAVTVDGLRGVLYVNGLPVVTNAAMNLSPASLQVTNVWLGRSQSAADPFFSGELDAVHVYGRVLDASEIALLPWLDADSHLPQAG